jgi:hypothetical protein
LPSIHAGRKVLTTVPLNYANAELLTSYEQLIDAEHCDILLDEVAAIASSRESSRLPAPVVNLFQQLRKRDCVVRFSAPAFARADKVLRETCQAVTYCRSFASKWDEASSWPTKRVIWMRTFDAYQFDNFTNAKTDSVRSIARQWIWRPGHEVDGLYDTLAPVSYMGVVSESGACARCGGSRPRPKCSCPKAEEVVIGEPPPLSLLPRPN